MNFVEPIRDRKKITQIKNLLRGQGSYRDLLLFVMGINTALRISDLLQLKVGHVLDEQKKIKLLFWIKERKKGKRHEVVVNESMRTVLEPYLSCYSGIEENSDHFLFFSSKNPDFSEPIRRGQVWKFVTKICREVGLRGNFGTHSLQKTWGYHARLQGVELALIMYKLNHNSIAYTKRYLGITDAELQSVVQRLTSDFHGAAYDGLQTPTFPGS